MTRIRLLFGLPFLVLAGGCTNTSTPALAPQTAPAGGTAVVAAAAPASPDSTFRTDRELRFVGQVRLAQYGSMNLPRSTDTQVLRLGQFACTRLVGQPFSTTVRSLAAGQWHPSSLQASDMVRAAVNAFCPVYTKKTWPDAGEADPEPEPTRPAAGTKRQAAPQQADAPPAAPGGGRTLLQFAGHGTKISERFTTTGPWKLHYSYDCSREYGGSSYFIASASGSMDNGVNESGSKGSDTTPQYGTGTMHLEVTSQCNWSVRVTQ